LKSISKPRWDKSLTKACGSADLARYKVKDLRNIAFLSPSMEFVNKYIRFGSVVHNNKRFRILIFPLGQVFNESLCASGLGLL